MFPLVKPSEIVWYMSLRGTSLKDKSHRNEIPFWLNECWNRTPHRPARHPHHPRGKGRRRENGLCHFYGRHNLPEANCLVILLSSSSCPKPLPEVMSSSLMLGFGRDLPFLTESILSAETVSSWHVHRCYDFGAEIVPNPTWREDGKWRRRKCRRENIL